MIRSVLEVLNLTCLALPPRARLLVCARVQAWTDEMRESAQSELGGEREEPARPARPYVDADGDAAGFRAHWSPRKCGVR